MKCMFCGHNLPDDSQFCQYCGKELIIEQRGTLGLDENNPVLAGGIDAEKEYISKLCTLDNKPINWERIGSKSVESVNAIVDIYSGEDEEGNKYGPIYINMYANETTNVAVEGFSLASPIESTYDPSTQLITSLIQNQLQKDFEKFKQEGTNSEKLNNDNSQPVLHKDSKKTELKKQKRDKGKNNKNYKSNTVLILSLAITGALLIASLVGVFVLNDSLTKVKAENEQLQKDISLKQSSADSYKKLYENTKKELDAQESLYNYRKHQDDYANNYELNFYREKVCFVVDGSNYYHTFDCNTFKNADTFLAYNVENAKAQGYSECPYCH